MRYEDAPLAPGGEGPWGHVGDFRRDRLGTLARFAHLPGGVYRLKTPFSLARAALAHDPDLVAEVLVEKVKVLAKSDMLRFALRNLAGEGLFTSRGELWRRQRKTMAPLFTPRALAQYADDMVACTHATASRWRDGERLELAHETTRLTMAVAGKTLFDADTTSDADRLGEALTIALTWTGEVIGQPYALAHVFTKRSLEQVAERLPGRAGELTARLAERFTGPVALVGPKGRAFAAAIASLDAHVQGMIDERRRRGPGAPADLLAKLLAARDEGGEGMTDRQVRDEVLTLFVAGHETTATGLAWTIYLAAKHPDVYAAMEAEARAVGDQPTIDDLPRLPLCLRVFKEALRLYPPVFMFGRDTTEDVELGGYVVPRRTNVMISPWAIHHAAHVWDDPWRFDPDRFLPEREAARHRYAFLPFGAGPRVCLGNHFSYMEAQLVLAVLLSRFRFELLGDDEPTPGATLRPRHGVRVRVHLRD